MFRRKTKKDPRPPQDSRQVIAFLDTLIGFQGFMMMAQFLMLDDGDDKDMKIVQDLSLNQGAESETSVVKSRATVTILGQSIPIPNDFFLESGDLLYFDFFIEKFSDVFSMGIINGKRPLWNMVSRALEHHALRFTLIAVSAWLYDGIANRSRERSVANLRKAIPMIQQAVTSTSLNDGYAFAVFMLIYLSIVRGDIRGVKLHLGGFYRILRHCAVLREDGSPGSSTTSLAMVLWRMAIRVDNMVGLCGQQTAFPITRTPESFHHNWVQEFDNPDRPDTPEWQYLSLCLMTC
jgi:hypothetical protein